MRKMTEIKDNAYAAIIGCGRTRFSELWDDSMSDLMLDSLLAALKSTNGNTEFKDILGWALLDMDASYGGPPIGGNELPLTTVTFNSNYVHDSNGSVALRGNNGAPTPTVTAIGNTWNNIGGNGGQAGLQWAALEVNNAALTNVKNNTINGVKKGVYTWLEGQAIQFWNIGVLDVQGNTITNNAQGIYIYSGGVGGPYCGTPGCPVPGGFISLNDIVGNTDYGLKVEAAAAGGPLNAECNWWGDASGPSGQGPGTGDGVSANVDYYPWLVESGGECPEVLTFFSRVKEPGGVWEQDYPFIDFGWLCVGDTACGELVVTNSGPMEITVVHVCTQCSVFAGSECRFFYVEPPAPRNDVLEPGESVTIRMCYHPFEEPPLQGFRWDRCYDAEVVFRIPGDPNYQKQGVYLEGKRSLEGCFMGRVVSEQDFGDVEVGTSHEQTITVSNTGCEPLTVSEIVSSHSEFAVVAPGVPFVVAEHSYQDVVVRFTPSEAGELSGLLSLVSNAQNRDISTGELISDVEVRVKGVGFEKIRGDVTGDYVLDVLDVIAVVNIILGSIVPTEYELWAADMDENGVVNVLDALAVVNLIIGGTAKSVVTPEVMGYFESMRSELSSVEYSRLMELIKGVQAPVPGGYSLAQNYPNPFNPITSIQYSVVSDQSSPHVTLRIFNLLGQEVAKLVDEAQDAGYYTVTWDGTDVASGIYFYRLTAGEFTATKRMVLMR